MHPLDYDQTLDHLAGRLPVRALHYVREHGGEIPPDLTDSNIAEALEDAGVHTFQIVRAAVQAVLAKKGGNTNASDIFHLVDPHLRGTHNPLVQYVQDLLKDR